MQELINRYVRDVAWIREELESFDDMLNPVMGVRDFDDAVCLRFKGKLVASTDGPYDKRLVMKSALVHAATDVAVKGGRPVFALDNLVGSKEDVREMLLSLKKQALAVGVPLIGGNTKYEDTKPAACITVFGQLIVDTPIRDCGAQKGDVIALFGQPLWGQQGERLQKANVMFAAWYDALKKVKFNSSKDVTKGGLVSTVYEMEEKSGRKFDITDCPYHKTRNLDNFLITLDEKEYGRLQKICLKHGCSLARVGVVN
jgi:selenophosphate synthetase-related protein